jgi:hypothetical protein
MQQKYLFLQSFQIVFILFLIGLDSSKIQSFVTPPGSLPRHSTRNNCYWKPSSSCRFVEGNSQSSSSNKDESSYDLAQRIMYNQQARKREEIRYQIIASEACESMAKRMSQQYPERFTFHPTTWGKFPDGTDNIEIGGFTPHNVISGEHVLFLASFHNNDVTLSQFQVMICLLQSFIESLTIVLPFSPVGTMERVIREGQVATAATYAHST